MSLVYIPTKNQDMVEGRGPIVPMWDVGAFETEQEAWDVVNDLPGCMGRHPSKFYPGETWQDHPEMMDYGVRSIKLNRS